MPLPTKKQIRQQFRDGVFKRDKLTCKVCGKTRPEAELDAHHITDREMMPAYGYSTLNGITVCKDTCHIECEQYHLTGGRKWAEGLHPDDLYKLIGTTYEKALDDCNRIHSYNYWGYR